MKKRIWELDALRGMTILLMVAVHLIYDLVYVFDVYTIEGPSLFQFLRDWGGIIFLVLSGICVTLGSHPIRRGILVFSCGMLISAVTLGMYRFGFADADIVIYFGVLHLLGICMILWPLLRKIPTFALPIIGASMIAGGLYLVSHVRTQSLLGVPFGIPCYGFLTSDYFPLLPNLGYFLIGVMLGRLFYKNRQSLLPALDGKSIVIRFFCLCGRQSLWIYMLHQPALYLILFLIL